MHLEPAALFSSDRAAPLHTAAEQNMLQDHVRTATYHDAIMKNATDFFGKTVLDVGTGSGILAYFAAKAGAVRVYAVEASDVADRAALLLQANGLADRIVVIKQKVRGYTATCATLRAGCVLSG